MHKKFIKSLLVFLLFTTSMLANEYQDIVNIELKKDEDKEIIVSYATSKRLFTFRWTLYANGGLVVLRSYDRIVAQNILYLRHKNQSFRVELKTKGANDFIVPYILVKFLEFDFERNSAKFQLFLSDKNSEISLKHVKDK